jgi:molybdopterin-guanine dinucleotide biosynthesis adapter protein
VTFVFGITGWKNSGKTTLVANLVREFTGRGLKVATIKHAHHHFDIDHEGTDSWKHREAGAREVAIVSGARWALMHELDDETEPSLDDVIARMSPADIIIIEGYKRETHLKIETRRKSSVDTEPLSDSDPYIIAVASDFTISESNLPVFDQQNIQTIANFLLARAGITTEAANVS